VSADGEAGGLSVELVLMGGKDRTLDEFRTHAPAAGLEVVAAGRLPSGRFAVECRPV
jgi:hypothetical protein